MTPKTWLMAGAAGVVAAGLLVWAFMPQAIPVEVTQVVVADFEAGIEEDARTRVRDRYNIYAPLAGRIERLPWREGDEVAAQSVVARMQPLLPPLLDERSRQTQVARVQSAYEAWLRAQVRQNKTRLTWTQAQHDLARSEQLKAQGFVSDAATDQARMLEASARKEWEVAVQDERVAQYEYAQARAALGDWLGTLQGEAPGAKQEAIQDQSRSWVPIRTPVKARVLRLPQLSETPVSAGTLLMELGDVASLEVVAPLLTTDAVKVKPGQAVRINRWGQAADLQGRVRTVEPGAYTKVSALGVEEQRVNVVIDFISPSSDWQSLGDAYRVGVFIRTMHAVQALQVPLSAVFPVGNQWSVFVVRQGHAHAQTIQVEARNTTHAWVAQGQGLHTGEQVVVYPPPSLKDGLRVRLRRLD